MDFVGLSTDINIDHANGGTNDHSIDRAITDIELPSYSVFQFRKCRADYNSRSRRAVQTLTYASS